MSRGNRKTGEQGLRSRRAAETYQAGGKAGRREGGKAESVRYASLTQYNGPMATHPPTHPPTRRRLLTLTCAQKGRVGWLLWRGIYIMKQARLAILLHPSYTSSLPLSLNFSLFHTLTRARTHTHTYSHTHLLTTLALNPSACTYKYMYYTRHAHAVR